MLLIVRRSQVNLQINFYLDPKLFIASKMLWCQLVRKQGKLRFANEAAFEDFI